MNKIVCTLALLLGLVQGSWGIIVKGRVTDEKGEGLAFATVMQKGTTNGTSANADGNYSLEVPAGGGDLVCQYMGYVTLSQKLGTAPEQRIDFRMRPQDLEIAEVKITANGEDPAYAIMRKVIAMRKEHAKRVKTLQTDIYLKGELKVANMPGKIFGYSLDKQEVKESMLDEGLDSSGKGILFLLEQYSQYAYKANDKHRTRILAVRESGAPQGLGLAEMPPIINIYDNNISLLGLNPRGFISPANSNAFLYYRFRLLGSFMDEERMIHKIQVVPKRKYEPLFNGIVYVVEKEWVFQALDLVLTAESQINIDSLRLEQSYVPTDNGIWIIQSQVLHPVIPLMGFKFAGDFVTSYKNQKVNEEIDDSYFSGKVISSYDTAALSYKATYWDTVRPIPLQAEEIEAYRFKDSVYEVRKSDTLARKREGIGFSIGGLSVRGKGWHLNSNGPLDWARYNTVEGLNVTLGLDANIALGKGYALKADWSNRYGFSNTRYNALAGLSIHHESGTQKDKRGSLGIKGGRYVYQINNNDPISPLMNVLYTLFTGYNYMKLYEGRGLSINAAQDFGNGFRAGLSLQYEKREPLWNTTDYVFFESDKPNLSPNQPAGLPALEPHGAFLVAAVMSYQPGWKYVQYPKYRSPVRSAAPIFTLRYTKGLPDVFESKSDFDKWSFDVEQKIGMRLLGVLSYRAMIGGFLNKGYVGLPDWKHLNGNQTFLASSYLNSFQLAPYYRFSNTADFYLQAHLEWALKGWLTNKVPGFRKLGWNLVTGANALIIDKNNYYSEIFVGLDDIGYKLFRMGRLDFLAGYESGKGKPSVGLRLGLGGVFLGGKRTD